VVCGSEEAAAGKAGCEERRIQTRSIGSQSSKGQWSTNGLEVGDSGWVEETSLPRADS
jgi:hypothetical protein